jgi:hypothetical protein
MLSRRRLAPERSCAPKLVAVDAVYMNVVCSAETRGAGGDGIHHGLHIRGRATDDAQDLAGCGLLLQSLGEFALQRLDLSLLDGG